MKLGNKLLAFWLCFPVVAQAATHDVETLAQLKSALETAVSNEEDDTIILRAGEYDFSGQPGPLLYIPAGEPEPAEAYSLTVEGAGAESTLFLGKSISSFLHISTLNLIDDSRLVVKLSGIGFRNPGGRLQIETNGAGVDLDGLSLVSDACNDKDERLLVSTGSGAISLSNGIFESQTDCNAGQGVELITDSGKVLVVLSQFTGNRNNLFGSGLTVACNRAAVTISGNAFQDFSTASMAQFSSAGLQINGLDQCTARIENNNFLENTGSYGGAMAFDGKGQSSVSFEKNTFIGNLSKFGGGAVRIDVEAGTVRLNANRFWENTALEQGGGVYVAGTLETGSVLTNNLFCRNSANSGGAVFSWQGQMTMTNNTVHSNLAADRGGGLSVWLSGNEAFAKIYNNIVWNNSANNDGGDMYIDDDYDDKNLPSDRVGATVEIHNNDYSGLSVKIGDNLSQINNLNLNPLLDDQERLTQFSPVIDKGEPRAPELPELDLKGQSRSLDADNNGVAEPDMGSDEAISFLPNPTVVSTYPVDGSSNVSVDTEIRVNFSKPMDTQTITNQTIILNPTVAGIVSYNAQTNTAVFSLHDVILQYGTQYTVTVPTNVKDESGNGLISPYRWKFTTTSEGDPGPDPDPTDADAILANGCMCGTTGSSQSKSVWFLMAGCLWFFMFMRSKKVSS